MNTFNIPSIDHLTEGVHYRIVEWSFAEDTEANLLRHQQTNMPTRGMSASFADGQGCPEGEKMIFGACRKPGEKSNDDKDFDSSKKTKQEEDLEAQAKKEGSDFKKNKMIQDVKSGKKFGWAMKNGKPVMVEWGSVAGVKKVGPKQPAAKTGQASPKPKRQSSSTAGQLQGLQTALASQTTDAGRQAIQDQIDRLKAGG